MIVGEPKSISAHLCHPMINWKSFGLINVLNTGSMSEQKGLSFQISELNQCSNRTGIKLINWINQFDPIF